MKKINVQDYGICAKVKERKNTLYLLKLLDENKEEALELVFPEDTYHFYPDYAREELLYISNHDDDTIKRVVFDLKGYKNLKLTGNGSRFIFHTEEIPFYMNQCENIVVEGISIDYERPTFSEGIIEYVDAHTMRMFIDKEKYPYYIAHQRLFFTGENFCCELQYWLEMDQDTYAPVYGTDNLSFFAERDKYYGIWKEVGENLVEVTLDDENCTFFANSRVGNRVILRHHDRSHPAFYVTESKDILLKDIDIYHAVGMGVIGEVSENIELDHFNTTFNPEEKRPCTANADSAQFIYCKGKIYIHDCLFENQYDDPINIHGTYVKIHKIISKTEVLGELVHHQHKGVYVGYPGDSMEFVDHKTMLPKGSRVIERIEKINKDFMYIKFSEEIPEVQEMDALENITYVPEVLIENCILRNNRARGILMNVGGNAVIRKNTFQIPGAAILISSDCNGWFECGGTKHIVIEENVFENCSYFEPWGDYPILVEPNASEVLPHAYFHKSLIIRNNEFRCFDERLIRAYNLETLQFVGNVVKKTYDYPARVGGKFQLSHVGNFVEENNKYFE